MHPRAAAQLPHRLPVAGLDERVDHHRGPSPGPLHREREILHRLDAWVPHLLEGEVGELRLEREDEPRRGLARRVREDVELDGDLVGHGREAR